MSDVIYVDDSNYHPEALKLIKNFPILNKIYTIRDKFKLPNGQTAIHLVEIENPLVNHPSGQGKFEPSFNIKRFTDLLGNPLSIEKITQKVKL